MYFRKAIVVIGPPGSGKGTQSTRIAAELGIPSISTGEMLRHEVESGSVLGRTVAALMAQGKLVEDGLMNQVVAERLSQSDCSNGFLLDGYPRTVEQARFLDGWLRERGWDAPVALHLDVAREEVVARLAARRQCPQCGQIYGSAPAGPQQCARDGSALVSRVDDEPDAVRERLRIYKQTADPLLRHYQSGDYHHIAASRSPEEVFSCIMQIFGDWQGVLSEPQPLRLAGYQVAGFLS
ncbi:MAG TPA: nucleoside monophosphate kinase [Bryobacteraceae bacterium]|nr:nucleoside monophosphate kinase [Bryobacteraceae bacterium]